MTCLLNTAGLYLIVMKATTPQLCLLRSLRKTGLPVSLLEIFLSRCGASQEDWQGLRDWGLVEQEGDRFVLTKIGQREYRGQSKGHYF